MPLFSVIFLWSVRIDCVDWKLRCLPCLEKDWMFLVFFKYALKSSNSSHVFFVQTTRDILVMKRSSKNMYIYGPNIWIFDLYAIQPNIARRITTTETLHILNFVFFHAFRLFWPKLMTGQMRSTQMQVNSVSKSPAMAKAGKFGGRWTTSKCWTDNSTDASTTESSAR